MLKVGNVVVDFYANWCNPCKMMSHTIDQVAAQFPSITFLKIDIDQFESIAQQVKSIPTLIFYKDGAQLTRFSGAKDKNSFISLLNKWFK
jgi:thioredoxin 1